MLDEKGYCEVQVRVNSVCCIVALLFRCIILKTLSLAKFASPDWGFVSLSERLNASQFP